MIYIADGERNFRCEIESLAQGNPFGCRILSLFNTYGFSLPFADFWVQIAGSEAVAAVSRIDSSFIVRTTDGADTEELSAFLRVSGASVILSDTPLDCHMNFRSGPVLFNRGILVISEDYGVITPEIMEFYSVIEKSASKNFTPPSYESFLLDVGNRLQKGAARLLGVEEKGELAACVMTLAESADSAVLGALATLPEYRKKGLGRFLIKYINNELIGEGKTVFMHRAEDENIDFYNRLGFKEYGKWIEYYD